MNSDTSAYESVSHFTMMTESRHKYPTYDKLCIYGCGNCRRFNSQYCEFHYDEEHYSSR